MARKVHVVMRYTTRGVFPCYDNYTPVKAFLDRKLAKDFLKERNSNPRCTGIFSLCSCELVDK